jgi:hypothetical protein
MQKLRPPQKAEHWQGATAATNGVDMVEQAKAAAE